MSDKYITVPQESGSVNISEDVVVSLVQNAGTEVDAAGQGRTDAAQQ